MNTKIILLLSIIFSFASCMQSTQTQEASGSIIEQIGESFLFQASHMNEKELVSEQNEIIREQQIFATNMPDVPLSASWRITENPTIIVLPTQPSLEEGSSISPTKNTNSPSTVKTETVAPLSQTPITVQVKISTSSSPPSGVQYPEKNRYEENEENEEDEDENEEDERDDD